MSNRLDLDRPDPDRLRRFFSPRSIAVVGASNRSMWTHYLFSNLEAGGFTGRVMPVSRRGGDIAGVPSYPTLADLPEKPDQAILLTGATSIEGLLAECREQGISDVVVLAGGFGEMGEAGALLQQRIVGDAHDAGQLILGPNNLGFLNTSGNVAAFAHMTQIPLLAGGVGVASQSGALAIYLVPYMASRNVGVSTCATVGNEAMITAVDVIDHLVADPATNVICAYLEQIAHPEHFIAVAERARAAGKPIVVFKAGRAEAAARVAAAHTGALVGDDRITDAVFKQLGVIRVDSIEEMVSTAGVLDAYGALPGPRAGFVTGSGAMCALIAERCETVGIELPQLASETAAGLYEDGMPADALVNNPLDLTGITANNPTIMAQANMRLDADPNIDFVVATGALPANEAGEQMMQASLTATLESFAKASKPVVPMAFLATEFGQYARDFAARTGYPHTCDSYDRGIPAVAHSVWWGRRMRELQDESGSVEVSRIEAPDGRTEWTEVETAGFLRDHGVPVLSLELTTDADQAVSVAERLGYPVVLKVASPDIAHKSDVGGVQVALGDASEVRRAYAEIQRDVTERAPRARIHGIAVSPMRRSQAEILVGVVRDEQWGPILAVGLGGTFVEVLDDTAVARLPVSTAEIRRMLESLHGVDIIRGVRGAVGTDLGALAEVIGRIADLALGLGDQITALELNPVLLDGERIEAVDALIAWSDQLGGGDGDSV